MKEISRQEKRFVAADCGRGRLLAKNDVRMRPAWIQLQQRDDVDQWDFAPAWPARAPADPRLNLRNEIVDFARLVRK